MLLLEGMPWNILVCFLLAGVAVGVWRASVKKGR